MKLDRIDQYHLDAAEGWLELGNYLEANEELEQIRPELRGHPFVLQARQDIYAKAGKWEVAAEVARSLAIILPGNSWVWIQWAFALHELERTREAKGVLLPVADRFPDQAMIRYNLACYSCQLGEMEESMQWLGKAMDLAGKKEIRRIALNDADMKPLWSEIVNV